MTASDYFQKKILPILQQTITECLEALQEAEQLSQTSENLMIYAPQIATTQAALTQINADAKNVELASMAPNN